MSTLVDATGLPGSSIGTSAHAARILAAYAGIRGFRAWRHWTATRRERKIDGSAVRRREDAVSIITMTLDAVRRFVAAVGNLAPTPPSSDALPPDIDGRRQADLDPEALRRVERSRKEGKGGYR